MSQVAPPGFTHSPKTSLLDRRAEREGLGPLRGRLRLLHGRGEAVQHRGQPRRRQHRDRDPQGVPEGADADRVRHVRRHSRPLHLDRQRRRLGSHRAGQSEAQGRHQTGTPRQEVETTCLLHSGTGPRGGHVRRETALRQSGQRADQEEHLPSGLASRSERDGAGVEVDTAAAADRRDRDVAGVARAPQEVALGVDKGAEQGDAEELDDGVRVLLDAVDESPPEGTR
jgi:hypothetical protein